MACLWQRRSYPETWSALQERESTTRSGMLKLSTWLNKLILTCSEPWKSSVTSSNTSWFKSGTRRWPFLWQSTLRERLGIRNQRVTSANSWAQDSSSKSLYRSSAHSKTFRSSRSLCTVHLTSTQSTFLKQTGTIWGCGWMQVSSRESPNYSNWTKGPKPNKSPAIRTSSSSGRIRFASKATSVHLVKLYSPCSLILTWRWPPIKDFCW